MLARISKNGTTDIAIFTNVTDSSGDQTILKESLFCHYQSIKVDTILSNVYLLFSATVNQL